MAQTDAQVAKTLLSAVEVAPQWVMGIEVAGLPLELPELSCPNSTVIASISQETLKPARATAPKEKYILQVQATPEWARNHLDITKEQASDLLTQELNRCLYEQYDHQTTVICNYSHRWLYSFVTKAIATEHHFVWDESGLALIGDYINNRGNKAHGIESAWLSAKQLAAWLSQ